MIKFNRKGYMTVEIILASVITFVIAFFLIDLTMDLSSDVDDGYVDTVLLTDKALIIKNIKENLENDICSYGVIKSVTCNNVRCQIAMNNRNVILSVSDKNVTYNGGSNYSKKLSDNLSNVKITSSNSNGYYNFKISAGNIFVDDDYDMNIFVYNEC